MHRFFVSPEDITNGQAFIRGDGARQLSKVLRARAGMVVTVLDGTGTRFMVELSAVSDSEASGTVVSEGLSLGEPAMVVAVVQGLPRGDKLERIIQKCTELGAREIFPVSTSRAVVQLDDRRAGDRLSRWRRVAKEAAEQSSRGRVPHVGELMTWKDRLEALSTAGYRLLVLWEGESQRGLMATLVEGASGRPPPLQPVALCIGPEGGLDEAEVEYAVALGAMPVTMGPRILRTETAGPVAVACCMVASGDLP